MGNTTQAGNVLIAEFLQLKNLHADNWFTDGQDIGIYVDDDVCYHSDWNLLMHVVEKISRIEFDRDEQELPFGGTEIIIHTHYPRTFGMLNNEGKPMVRFNAMGVHSADTLIEAAWKAVVEFIESYNTQSTD